MHSHLLEIVDLDIHDAVGQTELGNTIFQHASNLVESLEYMNFESLLGHVAGKAKSGRTRADDCHLDTVGRGNLGERHLTAFTLIVGCETLEITNSHCRLVHLEMDTLTLALFLLRTYTTADGGQGRGLLQHFGGSKNLATLDVLDERRDIDVDGTSLDT